MLRRGRGYPLSQKRAWQNKVAKGFNTTDIPLEFCLLQGEMAEAFDAWRKGRAYLGEELAGVAIYLLGLAEMTGIDLQDEIEAKMAKNAVRLYQRYRTVFSPRATTTSVSQPLIPLSSRVRLQNLTGLGRRIRERSGCRSLRARRVCGPLPTRRPPSSCHVLPLGP
jgi:hypothetical protein